MSERVGLIKSINDKKKVVIMEGYGRYLDNVTIPDETLGIDIDVPRILLDDGRKEYVYDTSFYSNEDNIKKIVDEYKIKGYQIVNHDNGHYNTAL